MKNKKIITILILGVLSLTLSFIIYNFNVFFISDSEKGIKDIDLSNVETIGMKYDEKLTGENSKKQIKLNYNGYVRKIVFKYKTYDFFPVKISYNTKDYYGKKVKKIEQENFLTIFNKSVVQINNRVTNIKIDLTEGRHFVIDSIQIDNSIGFNVYLFIAIYLSLIALSLIYSYYKHNLFGGKIEKLFLSLSLILGSLFIVLEPNTTSFSWDDQIHFNNIYTITEIDGKVDWTNSSSLMRETRPFGDEIDTKEEREEQDEYLNKNDNRISSIENNSRFIAYNEIGYIIPGIILKICSILGINFVAKFIITKFSILLFYSGIIYYSIKILPRGKRIMSIFGLLPSNLFLATQFSYDTPITAMICLFIAKLLNILEDSKSKINLKEVLFLYISIIFASFIKAIYIPLILLLLFIPKEKFNNEKQRKFFKIGSVLIFLFIMSTFVLPAVSGSNTVGDLRGGNTSVSGQLKNIINYPFGYLTLLYDTAVKSFINHFLGNRNLISYSYVMIDITNNLYQIMLFLFIFVIITDSYTNKKNISSKFKIFNVILNLGIVLLIWTALYLSFTPVGEKNIYGVQNRYFIPLLIPLILITLGNKKIKHSFNMIKYDSIIVLISTVVTIWSLFSIFFIYYCV